MKVYYIANARMPTERAHGIQLAKMCESLIESGADLELVVPRRSSRQDIQAFYGLRVPIPVTRLPVIPVYTYGSIGFILGSCSFMVSYFFYILWKKICNGACVLYTIDMDQFSFALVPYLGVPYFVEVHDAKENGFLFNTLFGRARGIIVIGGIIKEKLKSRFGIPDSRICVHPNGIDPAMYEGLPSRKDARKILGIPERAKIAVYAGKVYAWKGLAILSRASMLLPHVHVYCVGAAQSELEKEAGGLLSSRITCVGQKDFKEIPLWLSAADVCLVAGTRSNEYSYFHTSPMKMFEYMCASRPVVAARTPANCEIVSDQEAVLYEPDSEKDLAEKIHYAIFEKKAVREKVKNAYEKVMGFTWEKRAKSIAAFMTKQTS